MSQVIEGNLDARGLKFAIICARFNSFITDRLLAGATDALKRSGDAIIALGAVIRGETPHFDHVSAQAAHGLAAVPLESGVPVAFGVLTTNTVEQAIDRAGGKSGNKGYDAAITAIEMADLLRRLRK